MTQIESPKRKMQKKNDYQRHKLFRKIKRRRKAQAEAEQQIAAKQLRKKLKLPKFGDGKTREVYTSDIHFNNDDAAELIDMVTNLITQSCLMLLLLLEKYLHLKIQKSRQEERLLRTKQTK